MLTPLSMGVPHFLAIKMVKGCFIFSSISTGSVYNRRVSKISSQLHFQEGTILYHLTFRCGVRNLPKGEQALTSGKQANQGRPKASEGNTSSQPRAKLDWLERRTIPRSLFFNRRCSHQLEKIIQEYINSPRKVMASTRIQSEIKFK